MPGRTFFVAFMQKTSTNGENNVPIFAQITKKNNLCGGFGDGQKNCQFNSRIGNSSKLK